MAVDVLTETVIARPRLEVAAFASDPERVPLWYVKSGRWSGRRSRRCVWARESRSWLAFSDAG